MLVLILCSFVSPVLATEETPIDSTKIGITDHAGALLPLDVEFSNEKGETVSLKSFFNGTKPVIVALVYYECPNLCSLLLKGLTDSLKQMSWKVGNQFEIVTVSIDPSDTKQLALKKKKAILKEYGHQEEAVANEWHFLTGTQENIQKLADALGFGFQYDTQEKQFVHAAGLFVVTPNGKIFRTLYGASFNPRDLTSTLLDAGEGKVGNWVDKFLNFLFKYDSIERKYKLNVGAIHELPLHYR